MPTARWGGRVRGLLAAAGPAGQVLDCRFPDRGA